MSTYRKNSTSEKNTERYILFTREYRNYGKSTRETTQCQQRHLQNTEYRNSNIIEKKEINCVFQKKKMHIKHVFMIIYLSNILKPTVFLSPK